MRKIKRISSLRPGFDGVQILSSELSDCRDYSIVVHLAEKDRVSLDIHIGEDILLSYSTMFAGGIWTELSDTNRDVRPDLNDLFSAMMILNEIRPDIRKFIRNASEEDIPLNALDGPLITPIKQGLYYYKGEVMEVIDGDTIRIMADQGMEDFSLEPLRLMRINAPEKRGVEKAEGLKSKDFLEKTLIGKRVYFETYKDKKSLDRYLVEVFLNGVNISDLMVSEGFAVYAKYG